MTQPRSAATIARELIASAVQDGLITSRQRVDMRQLATIEPVTAELRTFGRGEPALPADDGVHYFLYLLYPDGTRTPVIFPEHSIRTALYVHALAVKPDVAPKYAATGMNPFAEE